MTIMAHVDPNAEDDNDTTGMQVSTPTLEPRLQDALGRALQAHFDDIVSAPVPDHFLMLLAELEAKEQGHGA
jgi:Anti-sigma factor NepR